MNNHPQTNKLNIQVGDIYVYKNASGYTSTIKVSRITDKSIFVQSLCSMNGEWLREHREGVTSFLKYTKQS